MAKKKTFVKKESVNEKTVEVKKPVTATSDTPEVSTLSKLRASHKFRLGLILALMAVVGILFVFWTKARIALAIAFIALLAAVGLEASQNDFDLVKLMQTKSLEQSKVSRDTSGNILFDKNGNITTDKTVGKSSDKYNCDDFTTQPESQAFMNKVGGAKYDVNRLDGDKDGQACESLPQGK
ncbi:hypothetical protein BH11PAT1_BH11PAT1_4810 [soil metagenome]